MPKLLRSALIRFSVLGVLVAAALVAPKAEASILIFPAARYESLKSSDTTGLVGNGDSRVLSADGRLGLVFDTAGIYLGGLYRYEDSMSGANKAKGTGYGASAGIVARQFAIIGTYILDAERTYSSGTVESKVSQGKGMQIDVMYVAGVTATFGIGPQLTYRDIKFARSTPSGGVENENTYQEKTIEPGIVFWWRF